MYQTTHCVITEDGYLKIHCHYNFLFETLSYPCYSRVLIFRISTFHDHPSEYHSFDLFWLIP